MIFGFLVLQRMCPHVKKMEKVLKYHTAVILFFPSVLENVGFSFIFT